MVLVRMLVGVSLLTLGRKLYWLFVGLSGFLAAFFLAEGYFLPQQPEWVVLLVALLAGIVGVFLAIFLQHVAVFLGGFLAGAYLAGTLLAGSNWQVGEYHWVLMVIGGAVCAVLALVLFDWALIFISSLAGALVIAQSLHLTASVTTLVTIGLFILGVVIQAAIKQRETAPSQEEAQSSPGEAAPPPAA
jgi:hypothetical protein